MATFGMSIGNIDANYWWEPKIQTNLAISMTGRQDPLPNIGGTTNADNGYPLGRCVQ